MHNSQDNTFRLFRKYDFNSNDALSSLLKLLDQLFYCQRISLKESSFLKEKLSFYNKKFISHSFGLLKILRKCLSNQKWKHQGCLSEHLYILRIYFQFPPRNPFRRFRTCITSIILYSCIDEHSPVSPIPPYIGIH